MYLAGHHISHHLLISVSEMMNLTMLQWWILLKCQFRTPIIFMKGPIEKRITHIYANWVSVTDIVEYARIWKYFQNELIIHLIFVCSLWLKVSIILQIDLSATDAERLIRNPGPFGRMKAPWIDYLLLEVKGQLCFECTVAQWAGSKSDARVF